MSLINRRRFLQTTGTLAALSGSSRAAIPPVTLVVDPADPIANSGPAKWAVQELERSITTAGATVQRSRSLAEAKPGTQCVVAAGAQSAVARDLLKAAGV